MKKRYEIFYRLFSDNFEFIKKEKVLLKTNSLFYARFYFKDRINIFKDFVVNKPVEVRIYDYKKHCCIARFTYFIERKKRNEKKYY